MVLKKTFKMNKVKEVTFICFSSPTLEELNNPKWERKLPASVGPHFLECTNFFLPLLILEFIIVFVGAGFRCTSHVKDDRMCPLM